MSKGKSPTRPEEILTLVLFACTQALLIPLKPYFMQEGEISILFLFGYEIIAITSIVMLYFLLKYVRIKGGSALEDSAPSPQFAYAAVDSPHNTATQEEAVSPSSDTSVAEEAQSAFDEPQVESDDAPSSNECASCLEHMSAYEELQEKMMRVQESEAFLQQRIDSLEKELKKAEALLQDREKERWIYTTKIDSLFSLSRQLSRDLKAQCQMLDEERKKHAIEMRTILKKDQKGQGDVFSGSKDKGMEGALHMHHAGKQGGGFSVPQGTSIESAMSCFLSLCRDAIREGGDWPSKDHPHLMRRKFYDSVLRLRTCKVGATSVKSPHAEMTLSPLLEGIRDDLAEVIETHKDTLSTLEDHEPFFISHPKGNIVVFRCHEDNLEDIILFGQK